MTFLRPESACVRVFSARRNKAGFLIPLPLSSLSGSTAFMRLNPIRAPPLHKNSKGGILMPPLQAVRMWWNWYTQRSLKPPSSEGNCGFEPHRPHHLHYHYPVTVPRSWAISSYSVKYIAALAGISLKINDLVFRFSQSIADSQFGTRK